MLFGKLCSRVGGSSKINVPVSEEFVKRTTKLAQDCGLAFGSIAITKNHLIWSKLCSSMAPKLVEKWALGGNESNHLHLWVVKGAQAVPNGGQSGSKERNCHQNGSKMLQKLCSRSENVVQYVPLLTFVVF